MDIRTFTLDDYERVARLWGVAGLPPKRGDDLASVRHKLERDPDLFVVAVEGTEIVGAAMGAYDGRRGSVYRVSVHPDHRRRGVGTAMMAEIETRLAAKGCIQVNLLVEAGNTEALAFYDRSGYRPIAYVGLSKRLPGPGPPG